MSIMNEIEKLAVTNPIEELIFQYIKNVAEYYDVRLLDRNEIDKERLKRTLEAINPLDIARSILYKYNKSDIEQTNVKQWLIDKLDSINLQVSDETITNILSDNNLWKNEVNTVIRKFYSYINETDIN